MQKFFAILILAAGCSEVPCPCANPKCGIECRNRCEKDRCIIGEKCCEKCVCPKKPPVKIQGPDAGSKTG